MDANAMGEDGAAEETKTGGKRGKRFKTWFIFNCRGTGSQKTAKSPLRVYNVDIS